VAQNGIFIKGNYMNKYYTADKLCELSPNFGKVGWLELNQWLNELATLTNSTRLQGDYECETGWGKTGFTSSSRTIRYDIFIFTHELHSFVKQHNKVLNKKVSVRYFTKNQKDEIGI
jgi:hypothetical protein